MSAVAVDETHFPTPIDLLCSRVQDTGIGISPEQLSTLFKSFSQSVCIHPAPTLCHQRAWLALGLPRAGTDWLTRANLFVSARLFFSADCRRVHHASGEYGGTGS